MWKLQAIVKMQPRVRTRESLPTPPKGMDWEQDEETHQWRLAPAASAKKPASERPPRQQPESSSSSAPVKVISVDSSSCEEKLDDDEWDLCSEKNSVTSFAAGSAVVVNRSGSVRSINSHDNNSASALSIPFKIQRTLSSSTIDSTDADRVMGLPGIDYTEHIVLPSDTLQGICLAYQISATRLRQVNQFSGNSLTMAPKKLIVPFSMQAIRSGFVKVQDQDSREYKIHAFLADFPLLKEPDAQGYVSKGILFHFFGNCVSPPTCVCVFHSPLASVTFVYIRLP